MMTTNKLNNNDKRPGLTLLTAKNVGPYLTNLSILEAIFTPDYLDAYGNLMQQ